MKKIEKNIVIITPAKPTMVWKTNLWKAIMYEFMTDWNSDMKTLIPRTTKAIGWALKSMANGVEKEISSRPRIKTTGLKSFSR